VLAIIRKEDGEEDVSRTKHCFMRVLGLIVSDKHRSDFFQSRLSCSRRELDNKETGKNRGDVGSPCGGLPQPGDRGK